MSDPDPAFTNLLMERENFGIALEISKAMPSVKERLYQSFWKQIEDDLRRRARALPGAWTLISTVKTGTDENARFPSTFPDEGRFLISKELPLANTRLLVGAAQEISGRIYYGIAYSREQPVPPSVKEVSKLRENIAVKLIGEPHVWWIAWSYKELDADALLRCVADNVELTAGETSNEVFELLEHHLDAIRAADRALYFQSITHSRSSDVIDPANPP